MMHCAILRGHGSSWGLRAVSLVSQSIIALKNTNEAIYTTYFRYFSSGVFKPIKSCAIFVFLVRSYFVDA